MKQRATSNGSKRPRMLAALITLISACGARTSLPIDGVGGGGGSAANKAKPCIAGQFPLEKALSTVMFVIDRSGSMGQRISENNSEHKWDLLREGLAATLPAVDQQVEMGALLFPSVGVVDKDSCAVPGAADLAPALGHAAAIRALLQANSPAGRTPTASALSSAANILTDTHAATSARAVVLATDGGPNCNPDLDPQSCLCAGNGCKTSQGCLDDARTIDTIATLAKSGIPTYVIGLGSDLDQQFGDVLNEMAIAGGRPRMGGQSSYYAVSSSQDLSDALIDVRDQVSRCSYLTASVPDANGTITIDLNGTEIPFDPSGVTGWSWGNQANGEIVFAGTTCDLVSQATDSPNASVTCGNASTSNSSQNASASTGSAAP